MEKKFIVEQKAFLSLLSSMQPICAKRTPLDATTTILFQVGHRELVLKSTDLEISLQASCDLIESSLEDNESFLVPGKRIFDVVKELEGTITCTLSNNQLTLQAGNVHLSLNSKDAHEFPPFPERIENLMHVQANKFSKLLESVAFLIPQNNTNPALNGLLLEITTEGLSMTTTDGHCLAQVATQEYKLAEPRTWLLPRRAIFELKKLLELMDTHALFLGMCGNQLVFSGEAFNFFTRVLADPFPQYRPILDKQSFSAATIDRASFIKTLRRCTSLLSGQFLATRFGFEPHAVRVNMHNKEVGKLDEQLPIQGFDEVNLEIRFYAPYILSGLQSFNEPTVQFYLKNSAKPIIFESQNAEQRITFLVMPVSPATNS